MKKLCKLAGTVKTRTTPYHPMGNGMCERFNKTLLNMLGTLNEHRNPTGNHMFQLSHMLIMQQHTRVPVLLLFI